MPYPGMPMPGAWVPARLVPQAFFQLPGAYDPYQQQMIKMQAEARIGAERAHIEIERARVAAQQDALRRERERNLAARLAANARQLDNMVQLFERNQAALAQPPARRARRR